MPTFKNPIYTQVGSSGITPGESVAVLSDFIGYTPNIERKGAGIMIPGVDYSWDADTGTISLLKDGDKFISGEYLYWTFNVEQAAFEGSDLSAGAWDQYRHILKYELADWGTDEDPALIEKKCRIEYNSQALQGFAENDQRYIGIIYIPLPGITIQEKTEVKVYEGTELMFAGTVKQSRRGYLNMRLWV